MNDCALKLTIQWGKCNAKQYIGNNNKDYSQNCKNTNSSSAKMEKKTDQTRIH